MKNLTPEIINAAKGAASAADLRKILGENGIEITQEDAERYFLQLRDSEVSDEDLSNVSGGFCDTQYVVSTSGRFNSRVEVVNGKKCPRCGGVLGRTKMSNRQMAGDASMKYLEVRCESDDAVILANFRYCDVKFLD